MFKNLPKICEEKLVPANFGKIKHLKGSKMIDDDDKLLSIEEQYKYTKEKPFKNDIIIITEKLDGMNAGVVKKNGVLYPINRKGYDTRTMGQTYNELKRLGLEWARWIDYNYEKYNDILEEGERLVFENCILQHSLRYNFKDKKPVFLLAKYDKFNKKLNYKNLTKLAEENDIQQVPLLNIGVAIDPKIILKQYPKGLCSSKDGIEGVVYNYEHDNEHISCAKYVNNKLIGEREMLLYYNKSKYKW